MLVTADAAVEQVGEKKHRKNVEYFTVGTAAPLVTVPSPTTDSLVVLGNTMLLMSVIAASNTASPLRTASSCNEGYVLVIGVAVLVLVWRELRYCNQASSTTR